MANKNKKEVYKKILEEKYGDEIDFSRVWKCYIGAVYKYDMICKKHGVFRDNLYRALPGPRMSLVLCPKCRLEKKEEKKLLVKEARDERRHEKIRKLMDNIKDMEPFDKDKETYSEYMVRKLSLMFKDKPYDFSKSVYIGVETPIEITCKLHGKFYRTPHSLYKASGCPKCNEDNRYAALRYSKEEIQKYIDEKYNGMYKIVDDSFTIASNDFKVKCKKHGEFNTTWNILKVSGCQGCFCERYSMPYEEFVRRSRKVHGDRYEYPREEYVNGRLKKRADGISGAGVVCKEHGLFRVNVSEHSRSDKPVGCPLCSMSKGELSIYNILKSIGLDFKREFSFDNSVFRYDFALLNSKILFEYDGIQHFMPIKHFEQKQPFPDRVRVDNKKSRIANEQGWTLLRLEYSLDSSNFRKLLLDYLYILELSEKDFVNRSYYRQYRRKRRKLKNRLARKRRNIDIIRNNLLEKTTYIGNPNRRDPTHIKLLKNNFYKRPLPILSRNT